MRATPVLRIDHGAAVAERWYRTGKQALELGQAHWALLHFEQAAAAQPESADAHNGRVVALARLGRRDDAIALARQLLASGLSSAELAGNLTVLEQQKRDVSPLSTPAIGQPQAVVGLERAVGAVDGVPVTPSQAPPPTLAQPTLAWVQHAPQILELKATQIAMPVTRLTAEPRLAAVAPAIAQRAMDRAYAEGSTAARHVSMEISNGAGRSNLARTTAAALKDEPGLTVVRLTNHAHFRQQQTEIHYRGPGHAATAQALAQRLSVPATLIESQVLRKDVGLKLVLGADIVGRVADGGAPVRPALRLALANTR